MEKPVVKIIGQDGNAFAILGACQRAAKKAGWTKEQIDEFMNTVKTGDYNHLLRTVMEYFEVE